MSMEIEQKGSQNFLPVFRTSEAVVNLIRSEGGRVNVQKDFATVFMPAGTLRKAEKPLLARPGFIHEKTYRGTLFQLPGGRILRYINHALLFVEDDED
jgi:hypothetical protein